MITDKEKVFQLSNFIKRNKICQKHIASLMDYSVAHVSKVLSGNSLITAKFINLLESSLHEYIDTVHHEWIDLVSKLSKEACDEGQQQ